MCTTAQILANQSNARRSTGPVTAEGRARVAQNATKFGLFSTANFIRAREQEAFEQFRAGYMAELSPATLLEETLAREIIHAAWRLRRCADAESAILENATPEELDRMQTSVDRARAAAQRTLFRALAELRRLQTERVHRAADSAKQSQSPQAGIAVRPRNAPCPCGSREKYKRCCGKTAPPVLTAPARSATGLQS